LHTLPHVPQFAAAESVFVSQPLALLASQLPQLVLHAPRVHALLTQEAAA
jgi:hypothetical protein